MKTLKYILFFILPLFALYGCEDDSGSNPVFGEDDYPFIYVTWQEKMAYKLGSTMVIEPQVSPTDGVKYKWTLNGEVISEERVLSYKLDEFLVDAELKLNVERYGKENSRVASLLVVQDYVPKDVDYKAVAWLTKNGKDSDVNWENISHLIISSVVVKADGTLDTSVFDNMDIPLLLTFARNYGVQVLMEVSGSISSYLNAVPSYASLDFYNAAVANPNALVANIVSTMKAQGLDGVNVYMDKAAATGAFEDPAALKVFYEKLGDAVKDSQNTIQGKEYNYVLSMSVYGGWTNASLMNVVNLPKYDWINVLAFAAEDLTPGPHASNWYATNQVTQWLNWYGVAAGRIVLGVPAFGLRYFGTPKDYTWANLGEYTEYMTYASICAKYADAPGKNTIVTIENGGDNNVAVDKTYYDGLADVKAKADFAIENNLGGIALWSIESDTKDPAKSLMKKINDTLNN